MTALLVVLGILVLALMAMGLALKFSRQQTQEFKLKYYDMVTKHNFLQRKVDILQETQKELEGINQKLQQELLEPNSKTLDEAKQRLEDELNETENSWFSNVAAKL